MLTTRIAINAWLGSGFFVVATEVINLTTQLARTGLITTGEGNRQGELKLLKLMFPRCATALRRGIGPALRRAATRCCVNSCVRS